MGRVVATLVPLVLLIAGCGPARESPADGDPRLVKISPSEVTTTIVGASPKQETILREILAGMGGVEFEQLEVRAADPRWGSEADGVGLIVPYRPGEGDVHAEWQSRLVAHAFATRSRELGLPRVTHLVPTGRDAEADSLGDPPARKAISTAEALRRAEDARHTAELFGADVKRVEVLEPHGIGFSIELQVKDDAAFFFRQGLGLVLASLQNAPDPLDAGDFSVVLDAQGRRIWEGAVASFGDGEVLTDWAKPSLRGCFWPHPGPPPGKPPLRCEDGEPRPRIEGASPKQELLLREILAGIGRTRVESIEVAEAADDMPGPAGAVQLTMQVPREDRVANWHMELIAYALRERSRELGLPPVVFYSGGVGGEALIDAPGSELTLAEARQIALRIRAAADRHGAEVLRLRLIRPNRFAFVLELQADDPAEFLARGFDEVVKPLDELGTRGHDGRSIEVIDGEGKFVLGSGGWFSVRDDLAGCPRVITSGPIGDPPPPPCPAE